MVAAGFCHDIDHRGTNNLYQTKWEFLRCHSLCLFPINALLQLNMLCVWWPLAGVYPRWPSCTAPQSWSGITWSTARRWWRMRWVHLLHANTHSSFTAGWLGCAETWFLSHFFLLFTGPEHLPKPSEASVRDGAASLWSLHHRHWSRPVLQVRSSLHPTSSTYQSVRLYLFSNVQSLNVVE